MSALCNARQVHARQAARYTRSCIHTPLGPQHCTLSLSGRGRQAAAQIRALELGKQHVADSASGANITKIVAAPGGADSSKGIYRISVPIPAMPPMLPEGFTFNQFLVVDDKPLLYHTGMKAIFPLVSKAIEAVKPVSSLAYIAYAHAESDECGSMNELLAAAPDAMPVCSQIEAATYSDNFLRPARALADGEELSLGSMNVRWLATPHTPHGWGTGFMFETTTKTLFVGDLFVQHGTAPEPLRDATDLGELNLKLFDEDYWPLHSKTLDHLRRLQDLQPQTMLCMHGSSFKGERCADMLRALGALRAEADARARKQAMAV